MNYKRSVIKTYNIAEPLYQESKWIPWIPCIQEIETLFAELDLKNVTTWDKNKIHKLIKIKEFGVLINIYSNALDEVYPYKAKFSQEKYLKITKHLVNHGLHVKMDDTLYMMLKTEKSWDIPSDDLYEKIKKSTLSYIKKFGIILFGIHLKNIANDMISISFRDHIKILTYALPLIKGILNESDSTNLLTITQLLITAMRPFDNHEDDVNVGNLYVTVCKYLICNFLDKDKLIGLIMGLTNHEQISPVGDLFKEEYFKILLQRFLSVEKRCNVCYQIPSKPCARCKVVRYCDTECQSLDWVNHKHVCKNDFEEPKLILPSSPKVEEILKLIDKIEEKYKDPYWNPFG